MRKPHPLVEVLAAHRHAQGMNQREAAELFGTSQPLVSGWETGRRGPTLAKFTEAAEAFGYELVLIRKEEPRA